MSSHQLDLPVRTQSGGDRIANVAETLRWSGPAREALDTQRDYVLLLGDRLGANLAAIGSDPLADRIKAALALMPDDAWVRLLTSPRCSYMLLWPSRHEPASVASFLADAAEVEVERARGFASTTIADAYPGVDAKWSALGDGWLGPDGRFVRGPVIEGFPPIDVGSPHALAIDLEGVVDENSDLRRPLGASEVQDVLKRLADLQDRLAATSEEVRAFVVAFTKVLVLQHDANAPTMFSTGSSAQYVGRSVFGNPHLQVVDDALLAEGLVHEAIHSLLYMSERLEPWVTTAEMYGPEHRTRSRWTGNPLPLRSYLQACFVWYGLAQFWCKALKAGTFPADRARARIVQSVRGFLDGSVLEQIEPYRAGIAAEVLDTINGLEAEIVESLG